ncbi:Succinate--hydroxymethylglutarate CoA-transferase [Cyphellophora attinorum]|uniref:Succinate--hydroxymethylglutarate CoA-transferase n=1 Tax=Cyphellophora attinorum TaxID=1664694 RepID=A0A0N0NHJ0_9EURO|nr:Succinate--hydroxymethylglutarate CoA-transferase [Phialophora attinorum]KPI34741.1 Succinate--hydroxymethylglutarate CoA-transferase [Phialophora attinorum]
MGSMSHYSVPSEAAKVLQNGIVSHSQHSSLPTEAKALASRIHFTGQEKPRLAVSWRFAESTSALLGLEAILINVLLGRRYNLEAQDVTIDTDHASLFIMSPYLVELEPDADADIVPTSLFESQAKFAKYFPNRDIHGMASTPLRRGVSNIYRAGDGRYVHTHASLDPTPSLNAMGLPADDPRVTNQEECWAVLKDTVASKTADEWDGVLGEDAKQACTICLDAEQYKASAQGKANAGVGLYRIHHQASDSLPKGWWPATALTSPTRPLAGLKVLDLTRVIASPTMTRGLAELGASVMRVTAPHLPDYSGLLPDLNWGKWNCSLDLRKAEDLAKLQNLLKEADVVVNGYRPGVLDKYGLSHEKVFELGKRRGRGFIYVRENCFGWEGGPLDHRSGWQPISDAHSGVSFGYGRSMGLDEPVTPIFPHSDFATGIAGTCAVLQALIERGEKGGNFLIDTALNYANQWLVKHVGEYPKEVWEDVWAANGKPVFRHWHNTGVILPAHLKLCAQQGLFEKRHFEVRKSGALGGLPMRMVKPVLQYLDGHVELGFNVGTRGNGVDAARWPEDLLNEVVE